MITVKGKYYRNEFEKSDFTKTFRNLDDMLEFMKSHVNGNLDKSWGGYGSKIRSANIHLGYHARLYEDRTKNSVEDTFRIERLEAMDDSWHLWIYFIESENGIEFTTGKFTSGQEHASKRFKEWALQKTKEMYLTAYKFAD